MNVNDWGKNECTIFRTNTNSSFMHSKLDKFTLKLSKIKEHNQRVSNCKIHTVMFLRIHILNSKLSVISNLKADVIEFFHFKY